MMALFRCGTASFTGLDLRINYGTRTRRSSMHLAKSYCPDLSTPIRMPCLPAHAQTSLNGEFKALHTLKFSRAAVEFCRASKRYGMLPSFACNLQVDFLSTALQRSKRRAG